MPEVVRQSNKNGWNADLFWGKMICFRFKEDNPPRMAVESTLVSTYADNGSKWFEATAMSMFYWKPLEANSCQCQLQDF